MITREDGSTEVKVTEPVIEELSGEAATNATMNETAIVQPGNTTQISEEQNKTEPEIPSFRYLGDPKVKGFPVPHRFRLIFQGVESKGSRGGAEEERGGAEEEGGGKEAPASKVAEADPGH